MEWGGGKRDLQLRGFQLRRKLVEDVSVFVRDVGSRSTSVCAWKL